MPEMLSPTTQSIVLERAAGHTQTQIAERHGVSRQRVGVVIAQAAVFVDRMLADLASAREHGNVVAYLVPYSLGLLFVDWLVGQLRHRGVEVKIDTRSAANGVALSQSWLSSNAATSRGVPLPGAPQRITGGG
jgi:hypothetical protein